MGGTGRMMVSFVTDGEMSIKVVAFNEEAEKHLAKFKVHERLDIEEQRMWIDVSAVHRATAGA